MKKQRKYYMPAEKVAILRQHLLERKQQKFACAHPPLGTFPNDDTP
jgi:hypothetical protein